MLRSGGCPNGTVIPQDDTQCLGSANGAPGRAGPEIESDAICLSLDGAKVLGHAASLASSSRARQPLLTPTMQVGERREPGWPWLRPGSGRAGRPGASSRPLPHRRSLPPSRAWRLAPCSLAPSAAAWWCGLRARTWPRCAPCPPAGSPMGPDCAAAGPAAPPTPPAHRSFHARRRLGRRPPAAALRPTPQVERVAKVGGLYKNFTSGQALSYLDGTLPGGACGLRCVCVCSGLGQPNNGAEIEGAAKTVRPCSRCSMPVASRWGHMAPARPRMPPPHASARCRLWL